MIDELTDTQKTLLLVSTTQLWNVTEEEGITIVYDENFKVLFKVRLSDMTMVKSYYSIYHPFNMALLARVIDWFEKGDNWQLPREADEACDERWQRWRNYTRNHLFLCSDTHTWMCQCADYGLQLAIEAGMVAIE